MKRQQNLVSYHRFLELLPRVVLLLCACAYLQRRFGGCTGIAFVGSTPIAVCHNRRITRHRVFKDLTARGRNTMGQYATRAELSTSQLI